MTETTPATDGAAEASTVGASSVGTGAVDASAIEASILALTAARGPAASICPSEVARALRPEDWRPLMGRVRQAAVRLTAAGSIDILRKGRPVAPADVRGVIRLRARGA